jgi:hypothetical protein
MKFAYIVYWCIINITYQNGDRVVSKDCGYSRRFNNREKYIEFVEYAPKSVKIVKIDSLKID